MIYARAGIGLTRVALAAGLAGGNLFGCRATDRAASEGDMITYEVATSRLEYAPGEEIRLNLTIANRGTGAIEIENPEANGTWPLYALRGPEFPGGLDFSNSLGGPQVAFGEEPLPPARIQIAGGDVWRGAVSLRPDCLPTQAGEYELTSRFERKQDTIQSKPARFLISPLAPAAVHLGFGSRPLGPGEGEIAFIHRGGERSVLYSLGYVETRPDISEPKLNAPLLRMPAGEAATDVGVPWRNGPFQEEVVRWLTWREGRRVHALATTGELVTAELPEDASRLVQPPLKTKDGPIDLLAVSADQKRLQLVQFPAAQGDRTAPPRLGWSVELPAVARGFGFALAGRAGDVTRHLAFVAPGRTVRFYYTSYEPAAAAPEHFAWVDSDCGRLWSAAAPALFVHDDGHVRVAVLALAEEREPRCNLVEATFGPEGKAVGTPRIQNLGALPGPPVEGALLYVGDNGRLERLEAIIRLEGGLLLKRTADRLDPVSVQGTATSPILLCPGQSVTYILYFDPATGFSMEPI